MRSVLALSLVGSTVALPFGDVLNTVFGRDPEPVPPPDFRPTRRPVPTGTGGYPYPTGNFPTATGVWPTGTGGMSALPFPYPTGPKTLSLDYGLAPTFIDETPELTEPTEVPGQEEASSGEEIEVEKEEPDLDNFTLADPEPTGGPAPRPSKPFPTFVATGIFPTGVFPTGGFPTGGFPTGYPTGVFPTGFPTGPHSTLLTFTRGPGPAPTGQPALPEDPTEEEWKAWWEKWLEWAQQFAGYGKPEGK